MAPSRSGVLGRRVLSIREIVLGALDPFTGLVLREIATSASRRSSALPW